MASPRILISAGEASGDRHAALLVAALRRRCPDVEIEALAGPACAAQGVPLLYPLADHAVMGFRRVFAALGQFLSLLSAVDRYLAKSPPSVVVPIDYPGFNSNLALLARRRGIPVCYYVCPQLWAWAAWRRRRFARAVDEGLAIFPFEVEFFENAGMRTTFVGHPLADRDPGDDAPEGASAAAEGVRIALLPGSRRHEIDAHLEWMARAAERLSALRGEALAFVSSHPDPAVRDRLRREFAERGVSLAEVAASAAGALRGASLAFVCSGTATLECALAQVPSVVLYRIGRFERPLARLLVDAPYIAQPNLLAGTEVFPEFLAHRDPSAEMARVGASLLGPSAARTSALEELARLRARVFRPGVADRAAERILDWARPRH